MITFEAENVLRHIETRWQRPSTLIILNDTVLMKATEILPMSRDIMAEDCAIPAALVLLISVVWYFSTCFSSPRRERLGIEIEILNRLISNKTLVQKWFTFPFRKLKERTKIVQPIKEIDLLYLYSRRMTKEHQDCAEKVLKKSRFYPMICGRAEDRTIDKRPCYYVVLNGYVCHGLIATGLSATSGRDFLEFLYEK